MASIIFVALIKGRAGEGYHAEVPDLAACSADAADLGELLAALRQQVSSRLQALEDAGESWPEPRALEAFPREEGVNAILLDVPVDDPPVRVNVSLGERLVQRLDAAAQARGMTRSGFIAQSVRVTLGDRPRAGGGDFDATSRRLQEELSALGRRINDSLGPDSAFTRRMAEWDDRVIDGVRKAADSVSAAMARRRDPPRPGAEPFGGGGADGEPR
jgi:predicted RNase H-like HicB family nuclease